jgi:hypothetical protein
VGGAARRQREIGKPFAEGDNSGAIGRLGGTKMNGHGGM